MDFEAVFSYLTESFTKEGIDFALMGGFALQAAGHSRTTKDIDLLILKEDLPKVKKLLGAFGYECLHESEDVSHFRGKLRQLGAIDLLHAHRAYAKKMLKRAQPYAILRGRFEVRVIRPEDLIGLKVQASSNDPKRYHQDMADIEAVLRQNIKTLELSIIREYFALFDRESELEQMLKRIRDVDG